MSLPNFNQPYAIDFHPTDFLGFKTTPGVYILFAEKTLHPTLKNIYSNTNHPSINAIIVVTTMTTFDCSSVRIDDVLKRLRNSAHEKLSRVGTSL